MEIEDRFIKKELERKTKEFTEKIKSTDVVVFFGKGSCYGKEIPISCIFAVQTGKSVIFHHFEKDKSLIETSSNYLKEKNIIGTGFFNPNTKKRFYCIENEEESKGDVVDKTLLLLSMLTSEKDVEFVPFFNNKKEVIKKLYENI